MTVFLLFVYCRHETLQLITSDVEQCYCIHSLFCTVCCCMQFARSIRMVCSIQFTRHSLLLYMYTCCFRCKYPLYLGKLSKVNKCYAINQCVWAYNEHEYRMLLVRSYS